MLLHCEVDQVRPDDGLHAAIIDSLREVTKLRRGDVRFAVPPGSSAQ